MTTITLLLIFINNTAWLFTCLGFIFTKDQLNAYIAWTHWSINTSPADYIPQALTIAFASQLILVCMMYWSSIRGSFLSRRYKAIKTERKDLLQKTKLSAKQIAAQLKDLQKSGSVEDQNCILLERIYGLEAVNETLKLQNTEVLAENKILAKQAGKASVVRTKLVPTFADTVLQSAKDFFNNLKNKD